ncbi:hypothetical protein GPECTOR_101g23 [Gonium pectorale]|uniref:Uncharacterized protein n=1 Tax=Gonium pectorale TaxID=33097 RepID=A0A150FZU7_GONPE|nr:hypothetical protein GPECTOR_101g23 [Gonium pectorale]|eukprot:KXZ43122.1 hypothetical protein GPECTOR_101g23 [Gonium pectorale]
MKALSLVAIERSNETVVRWEGASRVEYQYALVQGYVKVEVVPAGSTTVHKWQQTANEDKKLNNSVQALFCTDYTMPAEFMSAVAATGNKIANFSYVGLDVVNERAARHFKLTIKQPQSSNSLLELPATATVDYYDTVGTFEPLAFVFDHPFTGRVHIHVLEFRALSADSPEASPELYKAPAESECGNSIRVPRLLSPFELRDVQTVVNVEPEVIPEGVRRQMLDQSAERFAIWKSLDHVNGTGEWPAWALEAYGGVRPSAQRQQELLDEEHDVMEEEQDVMERRSLQVSWFPNECAKGPTFKVPAGPCEIAFGTSGSSFFLEGSCDRDMNYNGISLGGSINGDLCEETARGCVKASITPPGSFFRKLGISDMSFEVAKLCLGYDFADDVLFLDVTITLPAFFAKVELTFVFK